jgi:hypothetical protein
LLPRWSSKTHRLRGNELGTGGVFLAHESHPHSFDEYALYAPVTIILVENTFFVDLSGMFSGTSTRLARD